MPYKNEHCHAGRDHSQRDRNVSSSDKNDHPDRVCNCRKTFPLRGQLDRVSKMTITKTPDPLSAFSRVNIKPFPLIRLCIAAFTI